MDASSIASHIALSGVGVTVLIQVIKALLERIHQKELKSSVVIVGALVVSIIVAAMTRYLPTPILVEIAAIWGASLAIFDVVYKVIVCPLLALIQQDKA